MFAPPALWYQQFFWNTLLGRLLLGQLLLHKDIDQILVKKKGREEQKDLGFAGEKA